MNLYITKEQLLALTVGSLEIGESFEYGITQEEIERFTTLFKNNIYEVKKDFSICFDIPSGNTIFKDDYWRDNFRFFLDKYVPISYKQDLDKDVYKDYINAEIEKLIIELIRLGIIEKVARSVVEKTRAEFIKKHYDDIEIKNKVNFIPLKDINDHKTRTKKSFLKRGKKA